MNNQGRNQKSLIKIIVLLFIMCLSISCKRNKLKTNEKTLIKTIRTEEEQRAYELDLRNEKEKQLADSLAKLPKGFRFSQERGVDPNHQPMVIDIANNLNNVRDFSLSDVASSIEYIRMEEIPDSALPTNMEYKYYLMDKYIVALNLYGIHLFSKKGKFIRTIVKNEMNGITYDEKKDRVRIINSEYMKIGGGTSVWARGDNLFYYYQNSITGQRYIMEYDCSNNASLTPKKFDPEYPNNILAEGNVSVDLNYGRTPKPLIRRGNGSVSITHHSYYLRFGLFTPDRNMTVHFSNGKYMMHMVDKKGKTLASFKKNEQVTNYTKKVGRGTDSGTKYEKNGDLYYRTSFNDTIFKVIPPNRLLPTYVYNLGDYKLTMLQGKDPSFNLQGKIIPMDFADTKDYLFFTFTKDSYDCPNTRKKKKLKLYHAIFSKKEKQTFIVKGDPTDYDAPILKNNIDGGVHVWPDSYMIGCKGEMMIALNGDQLIKHVQSDAFLKSNVTPEKREGLKKLAESVKREEQILMIVK